MSAETTKPDFSRMKCAGVLTLIAVLAESGAALNQPVLMLLVGYTPARWLGWNLGMRGVAGTCLAAFAGLALTWGLQLSPLSGTQWISHVLAAAFLGVLSGSRAEDRTTEKRLMRTDALTRLPNREGFEKELQTLSQLAKEQLLSLAVACLDCDNFKEFNDTHGHRAGDHILRDVADVLHEATAGQCVSGRLGGDEFACVWVGLDLDQASHAAEKLQQDLNSSLSEAAPTTTWSLGVAYFSKMRSPEEMIDRADHLMLRGKRERKNSITFQDFSPNTEETADQVAYEPEA